jgi:hypothetical protein
MSAAADERQPYPYALKESASPAEIIATLEANRDDWPPSGQALHDAAIPAGVARVEKDAQLQEAIRRLIEAWQSGALRLYGLNERKSEFERISPGLEDYSDLYLDRVEIIGSNMFVPGVGPSARPMYRAIRIKRRALIDWASRLRTSTNTDPDEVPSSDERMVPASPEETPTNLSDHDTRSFQPPRADSEQVVANAEAPIEAGMAGQGSTDGPESAIPVRTGLPGRPTSKDIILAEAERRLAAGDYPETMTAFTQELAAWLARTQEGRKPEDRAPVPTPRTLENRVRPLCRKHGVYQTRKIPP